VVESNISRKVDCILRADCIASSAAGPNCNGYFSCWGYLHAYAVARRTIEALVARPQEAVAKVVANMLRRVRGNGVRRIAVFLELNGDRTKRLLQTTRRP
jgi:hypothetical protein